MNENPKVYSSCKDCIFATYANFFGSFLTNQNELEKSDGKCQNGCKVEMLQKFENLGVVVRERHDHTEKVINKVIERFCPMKRSPEWADAVPQEEWAQRAREEIRFQCEAQVIISEPVEMKDIERTVRSLTKQKLLPKKTVLIVNVGHDVVKPKSLIDMLNEQGRDIPEFDWQVRVVTERNGGQRVSAEKALDIQSLSTELPWYAVFRPGYEVPENFFSNIDAAINDNLTRFSLLTGDENGNGLVVQMAIHKVLDGNGEVEMVEGDPEDELENVKKTTLSGIANKVSFVAKELGQQHMVMTSLGASS